MSLDSTEQLKSFLEKSKDVLLLLSENPSGDAVGSAWALAHFLKLKNISATVAFSNHLAEKYSYLPRPENILTEISGARDFVLSFDTERNKITDLRSEQIENKFNVYLTPEKGTIDPRDFSFILAGPRDIRASAVRILSICPTSCDISISLRNTSLAPASLASFSISAVTIPE